MNRRRPPGTAGVLFWQSVYISCTAEPRFLQIVRFLSLYFSITYVFSTDANSSTPPPASIVYYIFI